MPDTHPTWNGRAIVVDTARLPYSHCAFLDGSNILTDPIAFGCSEHQAVTRLIEQLEDLAALRCSECDSTNVSLEQYDFGTDRETGYSDAGELIRCLDCGAHEPYEAAPASVPRKPAGSAKAFSPEVAA